MLQRILKGMLSRRLGHPNSLLPLSAFFFIRLFARVPPDALGHLNLLVPRERRIRDLAHESRKPGGLVNMSSVTTPRISRNILRGTIKA